MSNNKQQTTIDKLFSVIEDFLEIAPDNPLFKTLMEAKPRLKDIEKDQIELAFNQGYREGEIDGLSGGVQIGVDVSEFGNAEYYYNRTYGTK